MQSTDDEKGNALFLILESNDNNDYPFCGRCKYAIQKREEYLKGMGKYFLLKNLN